jgi:hypothetical protein
MEAQLETNAGEYRSPIQRPIEFGRRLPGGLAQNLIPQKIKLRLICCMLQEREMNEAKISFFILLETKWKYLTK